MEQVAKLPGSLPVFVPMLVSSRSKMSSVAMISHSRGKEGVGPAGEQGVVRGSLMQDILRTALLECKHSFSLQDQSSCQDLEKQVTQAPLGWVIGHATSQLLLPREVRG
jgi:hypothetical protein